MLFISILNLIGQKAGTLLNISLYSQLQLNTVLGNSSIHYGSYTWDLTFVEQVRFGVNEGRIKYQDFFLIVFVIYTIIIWGRQQIWKLRLWELTQLAQDDPAVKCKWNPCLTLFIALCVGCKRESMDEWVWEGSGTVFWAPPVYLFTIVFPDLGTVLASQEELNKYLLLNE